jgi:hypothetical protein
VTIQENTRNSDSPQLRQIILERSARQSNSDVAGEGCHRIENDSFAVLESMRLISDDARPVTAVQKRQVFHNSFVRRDDYIVLPFLNGGLQQVASACVNRNKKTGK